MGLHLEAAPIVSQIYILPSLTIKVAHTLFSQRSHTQSATVRLNAIFSPHHSVNIHSKIRPRCTLKNDLNVHLRCTKRVRSVGLFDVYATDLVDRNRRKKSSTNNVIEFEDPRKFPRASDDSSQEDDAVVFDGNFIASVHTDSSCPGRCWAYWDQRTLDGPINDDLR